jgi:hypothetical protein
MRRARPRTKKRPRFALPFGLNLADFDFVPTREERLLDRVNEMSKQWAAEDDERRRQREREIAKEIEQEKRKQELEDRREEIKRELEAEIERRKTYWERERKTGAAAMEKLIASYEAELSIEHAKRLKKLAQIAKDIARDKAKAERSEFARRGLIRGRRY